MSSCLDLNPPRGQKILVYLVNIPTNSRVKQTTLLMITQANALYSTAPIPSNTTANPSPAKEKPESPPPIARTATAEITPGEPAAAASGPDINMLGEDVPVSGEAEQIRPDTADTGAIEGESVDETPAPPTTRSKTAPMRKPRTPEPSAPPEEQKRGVITLSDVEASRAVLAEKANAHWVKGLGGGQNKEGETIVNFLYKLKAGPSKRCAFTQSHLLMHSQLAY